MSDLLLRTLRGEPVPRKPVWIMRQAGRYLPEYREVRARHEFLEMCRTPELAARVTVQPVERLGVDAAILFADILLPLMAMGADLAFEQGRGPVFARPVRSRAEAAELTRPDVERELGFVCDALRLVRRELDGRVPVIGFAGSPWTLACYLIEGSGSKGFPTAMSWSWRDPEGLALLLERIAEVSTEYVAAQVEAGAQAIQLFDTWGGLLDAKRWRDLALPALLRVLEPLRGRVPIIYYLHGGAHLLSELTALPTEAVSLDWRQPLHTARQTLGEARVLQGNLDPALLLAPIPVIEDEVRRLVDETPGPHIVNLGHGILPDTPAEHAQAFVRAVLRVPVAS
ncbi:MAG: uroporphyrinogen decarboxylase [Thermoanaerobaculia bacterium]